MTRQRTFAFALAKNTRFVLSYWHFVYRQIKCLLALNPLAVAISVIVNVSLITFTSWYVYLFIASYIAGWMMYLYSNAIREACWSQIFFWEEIIDG